MADEGWIKLYRSIRSNWLWDDGNERYLKWWLDILLDVNHSPKKTLINGKLIEVQTGEKKTSVLKLAERWGTNPKAVRKFLNILQEDGMIERKSRTTDGTTLKVLHYADYQSFEKEKGQRMGQRTTQQSTQRVTYKQELKELKKRTSPKSVTFDDDSEEMKSSKKLQFLMDRNNPNRDKKENLQSWAKTVQLMVNRDKRTIRQINFLIDWSQNNDFWKTNILSMSKLRKQFDVLVMQFKRERGNTASSNSVGGKPSSEAIRQQLSDYGDDTDTILINLQQAGYEITRKDIEDERSRE